MAFANKCWPAFPSQFGFESCYLNSCLVARGITVTCEVDIYGALFEYIGACVSGDAVTLLDINNSVPTQIWEEQIRDKFDYALTDTFMGFHCGNTPTCKLCADYAVKYQLIQHRPWVCSPPLMGPSRATPVAACPPPTCSLSVLQRIKHRPCCPEKG